jgi:SH3-like domain-containing protein
MMRLAPLFRLAIAVAMLVAATIPALAETPSGLPLPRFVTIRSNEVNVRVGPGPKYNIAWVYKVAGTPVEIIQEFDVWRKIRDVDGTEGWVHSTMLLGDRAGYVAPWADGARFALRTAASEEAGIAAWVAPGFRVKIQSCDGAWCEVAATSHPENAPATTYVGYLPETDLWGVYKGEQFD